MLDSSVIAVAVETSVARLACDEEISLLIVASVGLSDVSEAVVVESVLPSYSADEISVAEVESVCWLGISVGKVCKSLDDNAVSEEEASVIKEEFVA